MLRETIRRAVGRHRDRADYLEVRVESIQSTSVTLNDLTVETVRSVEELGGIVRAAYRGGWGSASFNDLRSLDEMISRAVIQARLVGQGKTCLAPLEPHESEYRPRIDRDPRGLSVEERVRLLRRYAERARAEGSLVQSVGSRYEDRYQKVFLATSEGTVLRRDRADVVLKIEIHAAVDGVSETCRVSRASGSGFDPITRMDEEVAAAARNATALVRAPLVRGGRYPVIVDPVLGGTFVHEAFGHTAEADAIMDNPSLQEVLRVGREIGHPELTLYDTGLDRDSPGFVPFDDEGVPGRRTDLVVGGVVRGHLHSRETAGRMGVEATGNARAVSYRFPPIVRMRNTCVAPGKWSFDDLLDGVDDGIYAVDMRGGTGGENFTFTAERGYRIRRGEICEMVRGVKLSGNLFHTLKRIDRVASDFRVTTTAASCGKGAQFPLPVGISAPHFRIDDCIVGGSGQ